MKKVIIVFLFSFYQIFGIAQCLQIFNVGGGGTACDGGSVTITLSGSEVGVDYYLSVPQPKMIGTGGPLTWIVSSSGTYTVRAFTNSCGYQDMSGSAVASVGPNIFSFIASISGNSIKCSYQTAIVTLSGSNPGINYQLRLNGENIGDEVPGIGGGLYWPGLTTPGTYTVMARDPIFGCSELMRSNNNTLSIVQRPLVFEVTGGGWICNGASATVTLSGSEVGVNYQLRLAGNDGTPVAGTGNVLTWNVTQAGTYMVIATKNGSPNCTTTMSGNALVISQSVPQAFTVSASGDPCTGYRIFLNDSQIGVNYQLRINNIDSGVSVAGTGASLEWPNQTETGPYTVIATNIAGCSAPMNGSPSIADPPIQFEISGGGILCPGESGTITLSGSEVGVMYQLKLDGDYRIGILSGTGGPLTWSDITVTSESYEIYASRSGPDCFYYPMLGTTYIRSGSFPHTSTVSIQNALCVNSSGYSVSLNSSETSAVSYQLKLNDFNVGDPVPGNDWNPLSWHNLMEPGTYTVMATNEYGCSKIMSGEAVIVSEPSLYSLNGSGEICEGSTGLTITLSSSQIGLSYQLKRNGENHGAAIIGTGDVLSWLNLTSAGVYAVQPSSCPPSITNSAEIIVHPLPTLYSVGGGGPVCPQATTDIDLSGSQSDVNYQLTINGINSDDAKPGTGSPLKWQAQGTLATYGVIATNALTGCVREMNGNAAITEAEVPNAIVSGPARLTTNAAVLQASTGTGYTYQWKRDNDDLSGATQSSIQVNKPGQYSVLVTASSGCSTLSPAHFVSSEIRQLFNGSIAAIHWRTDKAKGVNEEEFKGTYIFDYDEKYQLKETAYGVSNHVLNTYEAHGNKYRVSDLAYDPNGNIQSMRRYDGDQARMHDFQYHYGYDDPSPSYNNRLKKVDGYVNEYTYNEIGQMTGEDKVDVPAGASAQEGGDDQYVQYDVSGKVRKVFSDPAMTAASLKVEFLYDDRGFRLAKKNYETNKTTWYIRDAVGTVMSIYEENHTYNSFRQTEIPFYGSGKLGTVYPQEKYSAAYELTDHLGNVRAIIRDDDDEFVATIEDNGQADYTNPRVREMAVFQNLFETEKRDVRFNHTPGGEYSAYLYWIDGQQDSSNSVGPATALKVTAGDTVRLEAWARYEKRTSYTRNAPLVLIAQFLGNTFAYQGGFEGMNATQVASSFNAGIGVAGFGSDGTDETRPFAYLNYILFDENTLFVDGDRIRIPAEAGFDPGQEGLPDMHEKVEFEQPVIVPQNGYIYVWLSNESENTKVWYDDLKINIRRAYVAQATDYGPWGDVIREQKTEPTDMYRWYYQGQYAERDEETGWSHFELREYDPIIGRWTATDPYGQHWSPYLGMGNNPVGIVDPDGGWDDYERQADGSTKLVRETKDDFNRIYELDGSVGNYNKDGTLINMWLPEIVTMPNYAGENPNALGEIGAKTITNLLLTFAGGELVETVFAGGKVLNYSDEIIKAANNVDEALQGTYTVYKGIRNGKDVYWGITKNFAQRVKQHGDRFDDIVPVFQNVSKSVARGIEQIKIETHGLRNLENAINSVGKNNPNLMRYYKDAITYLKGL